MPDINKMMKMTPAEQEAYKQQLIKENAQIAENIAEKYNLNVNTDVLPGSEIKQPVKDIKRLSLIPSRPPTRTELVSSIQQSMQIVQQGIPAPKMVEIKKFEASVKVETIHEAAITSFYNNDPKEGLYLIMKAASESPDSLQWVNNLGAMLNLTGAEHKAVPILQYCLERVPNSSIVLNNIGQSFLGLGETLKAAEYLRRCLDIDSLNIEANHSMGLLHAFKKEYDVAMEYFSRELSMAMRRSTLAMAYKMGKSFDLSAIYKRKNSRNGRPEKDYLEEITLGKFSFPGLPTSTRDIKEREAELKSYTASIQAEMMYWMSVSNKINAQSIANKAETYPGLYHELAKAMLDELHKEFPPEFRNPYSKEDANVLKEITETNLKALMAAKPPPTPPGMGIDAQEAMETKFCESTLRPLADRLVSQMADHLNPIIKLGEQRWKLYLNQLVAIVHLDPSAGNQMQLYGAVSSYFNFLSWGAFWFTAGNINNWLSKCVDNYNEEKIDSLIESDRKWRVECPAWLNIEVDLGGAVVKADCSKYAIEAGEGIAAGFEHEFKSGNSTLLLGVAAKAEFLKGVVKAESKSQFYLTFDKNKQFADFGIKNTGEVGISGTPIPIRGIKVGGNLAGIEISNMMSLMSGAYTESFEKKGIIAAMFKDK